MKTTISLLVLCLVTLFAASTQAQSTVIAGLQVTYKSNGLQSLSYNGITLEDTKSHPADSFHIWHMKVTDLAGNVLTGEQYDWGEVNNSHIWDPVTQSWTYLYKWGMIRVQFVQSGDRLDMNVTTHNDANSGIVFDGAVIYPLALRFPKLPVGFGDPNYEHLAFNTTGPSVMVADFGAGEVLTVLTDGTKPLYTGFEPAGSPNAYFPIISGTPLDGMATFFPHNERPVHPGETDSYTVSLRFAPAGTPSGDLAADAYANWAAAWPSKLNWTDRRIIGTVFLASASDGTPKFPAGYPNNPRRYFNNNSSSTFDVRTPEGIARFQTRIMDQARSNVENLSRLNAQGAITWDIEGQQYPHSTSYVCSPDQIAQVAPEMESTITDPTSPYQGMRLDDAYFKVMRDHGFRVGVCIRPQQFTLYPDGSANQDLLPDDQVAAQLIRKIKYAHDRWAATIFYVDSSVDANGAALEPGIFQQVAAAFPDSLVIPEETSPKFYAYTAPFQTFIFHTDLGTPKDVYSFYPNAFSANLVNDVDAAKLAQYRPQLTESVRRGDILMVHADYWQDNNSIVMQIYQEAGVTQPGPDPQPVPEPEAPTPVAPAPVEPTPVEPAPVTPEPVPVTSIPVPAPEPAAPSSAVAIQFPVDGQTVSGTITVTVQIRSTLDAAGSYLIVDGQPMDARRVVSGPYVYSWNTGSLTDGVHTLQIWAHDTGNNTLLSPTISVNVVNGASTPAPPVTTPVQTPATPTLSPVVSPSFPLAIDVPGAEGPLSGTITVYATIPQTLSSAGSIVLLDDREVSRRLTSGPYIYSVNLNDVATGNHTLKVFALDIGNNHLFSNPVSITVAH